MNLSLEKEFSKAEIFERIDELKNQIDAMRPLSAEIEGRVMQKLRLDWNYNSNAIEGNKLNYGETTALLMHGVTAKGKPLKDHLDIQGHNAAIDFLLQMVKDERPLTETDIRGLHEVILGEPHTIAAQTADGTPTTKLLKSGEYKKLPNHVRTRTGETHYYATPEETPAKMNDLMQWYGNVLEDKTIHPIVVAALFHHRFVAIHPFDDGNGRMTRILMNLILMRSGYPVAVVKNDDKDNYYSLLSMADSNDDWPFVEYIAENVENSLMLYVKAINGGDIEEDEDLEKELTLFKMELNSYVTVTEKKTEEAVFKVFKEDIVPLLNKIAAKVAFFDEFFFSKAKRLRLKYSDEAGDGTNLSFPIGEKAVQGVESRIKEMKLIFYFKEFKNESYVFEILWSCFIVFGEYKYSFIINDEELISNYYNMNISRESQQRVMKRVITDIKTEIKKGVENKTL